jgi:putative ABC transport system permease protein
MIYETFREAIQNIWSNKFRTFLTMLGIIIGVMAVMVIVGLGNGMTTSIQNEFADMGTNLLTVQVMGYGSRSVKVKDFYELVEKNSDVLGDVSPNIRMSGTVKVGTDDDNYSSTSVEGVSEVYLNMAGYTIAQGRPLNYVDMDANKKVCVVGDYISRVGYGGNAIGQSIKIGREWYTIVGVLEAKIDDPSNQEGSSDDYIFVPYTTAMRVSGISTASSYAVLVSDEENISKGKAIIENGLQELLHSDSGYMVISLSEMLDMMTSMVNMVVTVLTAIAAISLLVGGIGIMNIMMVSVTERTREIGIRKALGAKERTILSLFVVEAGTTSALGGIIGIGLGYTVSALVTKVLAVIMTDMTITVTPTAGSIAVAFGISVGIGVLFGYLPAKRAASLNPIEALRYD